MSTAVIFANGAFHPPALGRPWLPDGARLIAADGGARHLDELGLTPDVLIGDFDSLSAQDVEAHEARGAEVIRFPPRKDATDLELAVQHALAGGAEELIILGAVGGRWDQSLANLLMPNLPDLAAVSVRFIDGAQEAIVLRGGGQVKLEGQPGDIVSLIPLDGRARGVTTEGLEYPLQDGELAFGSSRGVSNVLLREEATVSMVSGSLLCLVGHIGQAGEESDWS